MTTAQLLREGVAAAALALACVMAGPVRAAPGTSAGHDHGAMMGRSTGPVAPASVPRRGEAESARSRADAARRYFTDHRLLDQNGVERRFYSDVLEHKSVLINFIFTNCQDTCPVQSHKLSEVQKLLKPALGKDIRLVSISIDPERDTPAALKAFADRYDAGDGWLFLTGDRRRVEEVVRKLGQLTPSVDAHSTLFLLGNVDTGHWMKLRPDTVASTIARHLQVLASETQIRPGGPAN